MLERDAPRSRHAGRPGPIATLLCGQRAAEDADDDGGKNRHQWSAEPRSEMGSDQPLVAAHGTSYVDRSRSIQLSRQKLGNGFEVALPSALLAPQFD
jgi:hypothetical protein